MNPRISHAFLIITLLVRVDAKEIQIPELGAPHPSDKSYELVWQEEFSGTQLDRKKWSVVDDTIIGQYGHGNGEAQAYLDSEGDTFFVKNGKLASLHHCDFKIM